MSKLFYDLTFLVKYVLDIGSPVMLPAMIIILAVCIGVKIGRAVHSGLMVGVGFVGMGLLVEMLDDNMGPAAQQMAERMGVSLSIVEVGWPGMSGITWETVLATIAIPVAILVNLIMFVTKATKTINIDIWNIWHMAFTGGIAYVMTGNFWIGFLGMVVHAAITFKLGDLWAPFLSDYYELECITTPHGDAAYMAPIACLVDAVIDKIPGLRKINFSMDELQEKTGILGEPIVIGGILGTVIGLLAGYSVKEAIPLGIKMSAVMVLMPKAIKCIMDGIFPISERVKEIMHKHFGQDASFYIGLDPAVLLGDPEVITAGILFIPITLLIAILLPGNRILPFGDLATISFFFAISVAIHKGNLFRTILSGICIMTMTIWITNQTAEWTTILGESVGIAAHGKSIAAMEQGGCPITYIFTQLFTHENIPGLMLISVFYGVCIIVSIYHSKKCSVRINDHTSREKSML